MGVGLFKKSTLHFCKVLLVYIKLFATPSPMVGRRDEWTETVVGVRLECVGLRVVAGVVDLVSAVGLVGLVGAAW